MAVIRRVLDLSHYNAVTNLQTVKNAGIWGIIHKSTEALNYIDDKYAGRKKGFLEIGLLWGAYHFLHPGNIKAQLDFFLRVAGIDDQTLYAADWEKSSTGTANADEVAQFLHYLEAATGRKGVVYSGNVAKEQISGVNAYLGAHRLWLAQYAESGITTQASWRQNVWLWQYSDGRYGPEPHGCPGVTGDVDTNSWTGTQAELAASWSGTGSAIPAPSGLPPKFSPDTIAHLKAIAAASPIASYFWKDRGHATIGYIKGMAVAYAQAVTRFNAGDPIMLEMAKANTGNDAKDAISWYNSNFNALGMSNAKSGIDTLRHLYVLLMGLGMRESSGQHCAGRDTSASNTSAGTAEAGLFQTSWNAHSCSPYFGSLADQYTKNTPQGYMSVFAEGVSCSAGNWASLGSGAGFNFQVNCKFNPTFAAETAAITLRNLRQHYGPINRKEAEIRADADAMFKQVEAYVATLPPWSMTAPAPIPPAPVDPAPAPVPVATDLDKLLARKRALTAGSAEGSQWAFDAIEWLLKKAGGKS